MITLWIDYVSACAFVSKAAAYALIASGGASSIRRMSRPWRHCWPRWGAAGFPAVLAGAGGAEHDRVRGEAEAAIIFGVPTFVFDGELLWGDDRIGLLRERLDEKGVTRRRG